MQTSPILFGQYRPIDSFLHHLDTRAKLLPVILVLGLGLFTHSFIFYLVVIGLLLASLLLSGISVEQLARNLQPMLLLVGITFLYHLIFSGKGSVVLLAPLGLPIREEAIRAGTFFSLRLLLFVSMAFLVTLTSSPSQMAEAASKLLRPLGKLRVPVNDLSLILFIAMRFIPILFEEFVMIRNAQIVRGVNFEGNIFSRARKTLYLLIPVFVAAVNRADDLALALQARGYDRKVDRSYYSHARIRVTEYVFMSATAAVLVLLFVVTG
ncbi:MAG: energy-coupling factor transporter transmembrane protein EcfT [bacterium]|nr:energy-coupling factor transporter transmembrane protein EcfT [bacterium]